MKGFARVTKLSNVGGRADYISNPDRQEMIVAKSAPVDWKPYHDFECSKQKTLSSGKSIEAREVILALPNEWRKLPPGELSRRAQQLAVTAAGKSTDMQWAVHWNKAYTNLHMHIIFSERTRDKTPGTWDRDIYLTSEGKVARKAADRARDPNGNVLPPVHRKGELKGGFTAKDTKYKSVDWIPQMKEAVKEKFAEYGIDIEKPEFLSEFHEGKGSQSAKIRQKNVAIRITNANYKKFSAEQPNVSKKQTFKAKSKAVAAAKKGKVCDFERTLLGGIRVLTFSLKEWEKQQKKKEKHVEKPVESSQTAQIRVVEPKKANKPKKPSRAEKRALRAAEEAREVAERAKALEEARQRERLIEQRKSELAAGCELRWKTAEDLDFHGWRTADGERALEAMRTDKSAFPIVHRTDYGRWKTVIFSGDQWHDAILFYNKTFQLFNEWRDRQSGKTFSTVAQSREEIAKVRSDLNSRIQNASERRDEQENVGTKRKRSEHEIE